MGSQIRTLQESQPIALPRRVWISALLSNENPYSEKAVRRARDAPRNVDRHLSPEWMRNKPGYFQYGGSECEKTEESSYLSAQIHNSLTILENAPP